MELVIEGAVIMKLDKIKSWIVVVLNAHKLLLSKSMPLSYAIDYLIEQPNLDTGG